MVSIATVDGMPGVGKTTPAIRATHELKPLFPDEQFFVQLHAPETLAARRDLWRDRLADKRVLLVLDDVHNAEQIEPLLLVGARCLTLVTNRRRLVALDGATPSALDVLDPDLPRICS